MEKLVKELIMRCGIFIIIITWIVQLLYLAKIDRIDFVVSSAILCVFIYNVFKLYFTEKECKPEKVKKQ